MSKEPVVIIGAGWSGLAAAVQLTSQGKKVILFESARQVGGRARSVPFNKWQVDNGQHIMIGAYHNTLNLMKTVGINIESALQRLPLLLTVLDKADNHSLVLKAPALPAPLHLLYALLTAKGLTFKDRSAAVQFGLYLKKNNYRLNDDMSVQELFNLTNQTDRLVKQLWEPLVLSTMNTPINEASANVFMRVFKDAFTHKRKDSELLVPTTDLSRLFPQAAVNYIEQHGGMVQLKSRVEKINIKNNQVNSVIIKNNGGVEEIKTSQVIISSAPQNVSKLIAEHKALTGLNEKISQFNYEPIVTVYLQYPEKTKLAHPMLGMSGTISQWVFDRGAFCSQQGLISVVISASGEHMRIDDGKLAHLVHSEIAPHLSGQNEMLDSFVIREKRATFACNVNINNIRPQNKTSIKGLVIAGDYTDTGYPATLEGAIKSGISAANLI